MSSPFTDVFDIDLAVVLILHDFLNANNNIDVFILTMTPNDAITVNNGITQANNFNLYDY